MTDERGVILLNDATATGTGREFQVASLANKHTVQIDLGGDVVATAVTIGIEGSLNGISWHELAEHVLTAAELTAESAMFHVVDRPVTDVRLNLKVLTGGTNPTVAGRYVNNSTRPNLGKT